MIFPGTRSSRFAARSGLIGSPSCDVRNADGQTVSPVFGLINSEPSIPGITITGRLPVLALAVAKMFSRFGVRRAEMHALETSDNEMRPINKYRERANEDLFNGHRPAAIDEARNKAGTKAVVDINDSYI